jgi:hypothetical protein
MEAHTVRVDVDKRFFLPGNLVAARVRPIATNKTAATEANR